MKHQKSKTKKTREAEDKRVKKKAVERVLGVYKEEGQGYMLRLRKTGEWIELSRWSLHPEIGRWSHFVLSRDECKWLLLSLQYQLGRKSVGVRTKTRPRKSSNALRPQRKGTQSRRKLVRRKNKTL